MTTISAIVLPGSGWIFEWRSDGWWRELGSDQRRDEASGKLTPGPDEWVRWSGEQHHQFLRRIDPSGRPWIVAYEETSPDHAEKAQITGAASAHMISLGGHLLICEWIDEGQPVTISHAGQRWVAHIHPHDANRKEPGIPS